MKLRLALCTLGALAVVGAPALALAQDTVAPSANVEASTPVPNPPATAKAAHHAKHKAHHKAAAATPGVVTTVKAKK